MSNPHQLRLCVRVRLVEAGHILGSASVILTVADGGYEHLAVFSGDLRVNVS